MMENRFWEKNDVVGGGKPDLVQRQMTVDTHTQTNTQKIHIQNYNLMFDTYKRKNMKNHNFI